MTSEAPPQQGRNWAAIVAGAGFLLVLAYAVLAVVQILILNPLAAVPGRTLEQIHADLTARNESLAIPFVFFELAIGPLLAGVLLWLALMGRQRSALKSAVFALVLLGLGPLVYFFASFGAGMSLADTYGISGGDHSPWAGPLYVTSLLAWVALLVIGVVVAIRKSQLRIPRYEAQDRTSS